MVNKNKVASTDEPKEKVGFLNKNKEVTTSVIVPPDGNYTSFLPAINKKNAI